MLNFTGMLSAPDVERQPVFVATYSDGFGLKRKEIEAPNRFTAYAIATRRPPAGHELTGLHKKKAPRQQSRQTLDEKVDVKLTRALAGIYANTDIAARFVLAELHQLARVSA